MTEEARKLKNEYQRQWRAKNVKRLREKEKEWRAANKEKIRKYRQAYWERKAAEANKELKG